MPFNYNKLWKMLIDKGMRKDDLRNALNLSSSTIAKMGKGENISMDVIDRICNYFECDVCDIVEHIQTSDSLQQSNLISTRESPAPE